MLAQRQTESNVRQREPRAKTRVLIVDDNPDVVRTYDYMLRCAGFEVATASNGRDALKRVEEFHPQIALLDIGLPDLDGYEVARRLRNDLSCDSLALIAITAYGSDEYRQMAKEVGFDHFLVKPVLFDSLLTLIDPPS